MVFAFIMILVAMMSLFIMQQGIKQNEN